MGGLAFLLLGAAHTALTAFAGYFTSYLTQNQILAQTLDLSHQQTLDFYNKNVPKVIDLNISFDKVDFGGIDSFGWYWGLKTIIPGIVAYIGGNLSFQSYNTLPFYFGKYIFMFFFYHFEISITRVMFGLGNIEGYSGLIQGVSTIWRNEGFFDLPGLKYAILEFLVYSLITYYIEKWALNRKMKIAKSRGILMEVVLGDFVATAVSYSFGTLKRREIVKGVIDKGIGVKLASGYEGLYHGIFYKVVADLAKSLIVGIGKGGVLFFSLN